MVSLSLDELVEGGREADTESACVKNRNPSVELQAFDVSEIFSHAFLLFHDI